MDDQVDLRDFRITRSTDPSASLQTTIELGDWLAYISKDPDLVSVAFVLGRNPMTGENMDIPLDGGVKWVDQTQARSNPFAWWEKGEIVGSNVDPETVAKARQIAEALGARCIVTID